MTKDLIELGLGGDSNRNPQTPTDEQLNSGTVPLSAGLVQLISDTAVESDALNTTQFRAKLAHYREKLSNVEESDSDSPAVAAECFRVCQEYLLAARKYLLERESEFADVIDVMREALARLAGDAKAFNVRLSGSSERISRLIEIEDIRELKKQITQEVRDLDRVVEEKQKQDEVNYAKLASRIEVLQTNLSESRDEALLDPLTRLSNRGSFDRALKQWVDVHRDTGKPFVLAMVDIDNFKQVNDTHGHPVGDRVLYCAAEWLRKNCRPTDFLARYGGEEFVVMITEFTLSQAEARFGELLRDIANCNYTYTREDGECGIAFTVSCGLAEFSVQESGEDLLRRADEALYVAKKTGKNRVVLAKPQKSLWKTLTFRGTSRQVKQS
jgi:diguanylate cyclase (GGDEF)-like protein